MKNNILNRIISVMLMAVVGASLFSGCQSANDNEQAVTTAVSETTFEDAETEVTTEPAAEADTEVSTVETETVTETVQNEASASESETTELSETTEEQKSETTASKKTEKSDPQPPKYIESYKFTDKAKKQLENELYIMTSSRLGDDNILPEGKVTQQHIDRYVFSTFGNGESLWGLDYIETFDLSQKSDPLGKFNSVGLCDVYDAEGVDRFLYNVFGYKATHKEDYSYVYYHGGKYYKYTGDGGGYFELKIEGISELGDGKYLAKYVFKGDNVLFASAIFNVFDDNGRTRFHYCSVARDQPEKEKDQDAGESSEWYMEVIDQYKKVIAENVSYEFLWEDDTEYKYVPTALTHYYTMPEWYLYDIDGNGTKELICQYNIYLYDNGKIYMLFDPDGKHLSLGDRSRMSFYKNGIIGVHWAGGAFCFTNEYFVIDGNALKTIDAVYYDEFEDESDPVWRADDPNTHYQADMFEKFTAVYGKELDLSGYGIKLN